MHIMLDQHIDGGVLVASVSADRFNSLITQGPPSVHLSDRKLGIKRLGLGLKY